MSERGSWVSQYFYCYECMCKVHNIMKEHFDGTVIRLPSEGGLNIIMPPDEQDLYPILAGKAHGMWAGEEVSDFEYDIVPLLEKEICHEVRIAVIGEDGEKIFTIKPASEPV